MELSLNENLGSTTVEFHEASNPLGVAIIGHGAGAGMHHPFMITISNDIASMGFHVVRFNFPYMEEGRKSPGSPKKNIETWEHVIKHVHHTYPTLPIFLSGKSYGGRMASHLLADKQIDYVKGIFYLGFPLHAPGKDSKDRADHLGKIEVPQLFLQGTKDKLANITLMHEVVGELKQGVLVEIEAADHSFNVPKKVGLSKEEVIQQLASLAVNFKKNIVAKQP
ncbi:MAG: alpha/beta family hydrolase [Cyclobacteriaceae bacterium]